MPTTPLVMLNQLNDSGGCALADICFHQWYLKKEIFKNMGYFSIFMFLQLLRLAFLSIFNKKIGFERVSIMILALKKCQLFPLDPQLPHHQSCYKTLAFLLDL